MVNGRLLPWPKWKSGKIFLMELLCFVPSKEAYIIKEVVSKLENPPVITEVDIAKRQAQSKDFKFQIWPVLKIDGVPTFYGIRPIIKYLFAGNKLLPVSELSAFESMITFADLLYAAAAPIVAKEKQNILVKEDRLKKSNDELKVLLEKAQKYQNAQKKTIANIYLDAMLDVLKLIGIDIAPATAKDINVDGLAEDAVSFAISNLGIPERYAMSPVPEKKMYFSTPIYYVNGAPHIGHVFTTTLVESLANWYKLRHIPIIYSSGTDEHGLKVQTTAAEHKISPQAWCDQTSKVFFDAFKEFDLHPDVFIRTSEPRHIEVATKLWKILQEKGYIYKGKYEGWYSKREEAFVPENQIEEKEVDGVVKKFNKEDGAELIWSSEENYMFKLSAMNQPLLDWMNANPTCITPKQYYNHIKKSISGELRDLSISRQNVTWGIPVPGDEKQTMYVWIDALANYLTVAGWNGEEDGIWPADLHTVGKDIVKFHGIYWPAFLLAAGIKPYKRLLVHGWWTMSGEKMSKSLGNTLYPIKLRDFWGLEPVKYFLLREATLVNDADYSVEAMLNRTNNDLADVFWNLVMRILTPKFIGEEMKIPKCGELQNADRVIIENLESLPGNIDHFVQFGQTRLALIEIWNLFRDLNKYLTEQKPWTYKGKDDARFNTIAYVVIESLRIISLCLYPFIPNTATLLLDNLGAPAPLDNDPAVMFKFGYSKAGTQMKPAKVLFPKKKLD